MSFFLNLPIGKKLLAAFSLMALIVIVLGALSIIELDKVNYSSTVIVEQHLPRLIAVSTLDVKLSDFRRRQLRMLEKHDEAQTRLYAERLQQDQSSIDQTLTSLKQLSLSSEHATSLANLQNQWLSYSKQQQQIVNLHQQQKLSEAANLLNGPGDELFRNIKSQVAELIKTNKQDAEAASADGDERYARSKLLIGSLIGCALIMVAFCAWGLGNIIRKPILRLLEQAERVANGDLTSNLDYSRFCDDEIGTLAKSFGRMQHNLRTLVQELASAVEQLSSSAEEVSAIAEQSANGQQRQQSEITYLATAMNEMGSTVNEVARNTTHAASA
ncbi:MAG: methyl-accepting chemotaxis protein, partial [Aeromonadaceae bacterium]